MPEQVFIKLAGVEYEVLDSMNHITLADSFVKNKIGTAHGEAKLYIGYESPRLFDFFDNFERICFFRNEDFKKYLMDAEEEFIHPQQDYQDFENMPYKFQCLKGTLASFKDDILPFKIFIKDVERPRVYIQSDSEYYEFVREAGLPNFSYLSIMKLKSRKGEIYYYFRIFIDYASNENRHLRFLEHEEEKRIQKSTMTSEQKQVLIQARSGQGLYRKRLLEECQFCPISFIDDKRLLIASHIKPWAVSSDKEKIDSKNGFILCPNYDSLFDKGFITFNPDKSLCVSPWISPKNQQRLNIFTGKNISYLPLDLKREQYLIYHRKHIFKG